jgi:hypothetical protein
MNFHVAQVAMQAIMLSEMTVLVREASLGPRASLFVSAGVVAHTLSTSAAPAMDGEPTMSQTNRLPARRGSTAAAMATRAIRRTPR